MKESTADINASAIAAPLARDDATLMRAMADRDSTALSALYDKYSGAAYALCLRILHSRDDADELLTDVFMELWERSATYDASKSSVFTYLMTITRCRAIDRLRRKPRLKTQAMEAADNVTKSPGLHPAELKERAAQVRQSMAQLDELQRQAIEYSFWEDMSHSEIATKMNRPIGTVKTWIRQGLTLLRTRFKSSS